MRQWYSMLCIQAAALAGLVLVAGCGGKKPQIEPVFYPPPPDPPRLQFLTSFSDPKDWVVEKSSFAQFIAGANDKKDSDKPIKGPYGLGVRAGKLYICDLGSHCVHVIDFLNRTYARLGKAGVIRNPVNITISADGTKYVCDSFLRKVLVFDDKDRYVRALGDPAQCAPSDLAEAGDELIVTDIAGGELEVWDRDGKFLRLIAGRGKGPGQLMRPAFVQIAPDGHILVSDWMLSIVNVYAPDGKFTGMIGAPGDRPGYFARPKGIAIDPEGITYITDAQWEVTQVFAPDRRLLLFFGGANPKPWGMGTPSGLVIDRSALPAFEKYIAKDFKAEYLLFQANQNGINKIAVYAYGKSSNAEYPPLPAPRTAKPDTSKPEPAAE